MLGTEEATTIILTNEAEFTGTYMRHWALI